VTAAGLAARLRALEVRVAPPTGPLVFWLREGASDYDAVEAQLAQVRAEERRRVIVAYRTNIGSIE